MAELNFPTGGKHVGFPASKQPVNTSRDLNNVRPYFNGESVGGQRPALDKWGNGDQVGAAEQPVVAACTVSTVI